MLWKAQAIALSSDRPGVIVGNRQELFYKAVVASPEFGGKYGIALPYTKQTQSLLQLLIAKTNKEVKKRRVDLKGIPEYPRHYPTVVAETEENIKTILGNRYLSNRQAEAVGQQSFCQDLTSYYVDRSLQCGLHAGIVVVPFSISFSNMPVLARQLSPDSKELLMFSETHVAVMLMSGTDYICTRYNNQLSEKEYSFFSCYETRPQPIPDVFKSHFCVIADPWLQTWGEVSEKSWPTYLRGCIQESLFSYKVKHDGKNAPVIHDLRYTLTFNIIY